jgi:hypothetical protein
MANFGLGDSRMLALAPTIASLPRVKVWKRHNVMMLMMSSVRGITLHAGLCMLSSGE